MTGQGLIVGTRRFVATLATSDAELCEAQHLRYRVFAEELGARVPDEAGVLERDDLDAFCDHLLVRERASGRLVGTYRMLAPERAERAGGLCAEREFDMDRLLGLKPVTLEIGRACVDPDFRQGAVIALLWAGLLRYIFTSGCRYAIGCASVSLRGGHAAAAAICARLRAEHLGPERWRVFPRRAFPTDGCAATSVTCLPPLIKGYLRLGAWVCGDAAWDEAFNTADLLLLLPIARLDQRYVRWLLRIGLDEDDSHGHDTTRAA